MKRSKRKLDLETALAFKVDKKIQRGAAKKEILLKKFALVLGLSGALAAVFDAYPYTLFLSLPFCLIWIYCAWLRTEPQLKWINIIFSLLYLYGILRYFFDYT